MDKNLITFAIRLTALACLSSALALAASWSGTLVDSRCWDTAENNTRDTSVYVDRDGNLEIRLCSPRAKTKSFAVVLPGGLNLKLDAAGNARAAELVQKTGGKSPVTVAITGEASGNTIKVDSISMRR